MKIINCPICDCEISVDKEDIKEGTIFCHYCGTPIRLKKTTGSDDDVEAEENEDF